MVQGTIDSRASLRRAAILLATFDERVARALLGKLPAMQRARLRRAVSDLEDVDPLERRRAQSEFLQETRQQISPSEQGEARYNSDSVELRLRGEEAHGEAGDGSRQADDVPAAPPLAFLCDVPDDILLSAIVGEHPQTIAIVLASLAPHQAARLLPGLSDSLRTQALSRLAKLEQLPPDALDSIGEHLRRLLADVTPTSVGVGAGGRSLQAILAELPQEARHGVATDLGIDPRSLPGQTDPSATTRGEAAVSQERETDTYERQSTGPASDDLSGPRLAVDTVESEAPAAASSGSPRQAEVAPEGQAANRDVRQIDLFLTQLPTEALRDALARLETRDALLALCGLSRRDADRVLRSLPRRQAKQIRNQLAGLGSLTIHQVDNAKFQVAALAGLPSDDPSVGTGLSSLLTAA